MRFTVSTILLIVSWAAVNLSLSLVELKTAVLALFPILLVFVFIFLKPDARKRAMLGTLVVWFAGSVGFAFYNSSVNGFIFPGRNRLEFSAYHDAYHLLAPAIIFGGAWLGVTVGMILRSSATEYESPFDASSASQSPHPTLGHLLPKEKERWLTSEE